MNNIKLKSFHAKRYRSLLDINIEVDQKQPVIVCGENNIGKTNLLRAMNVFFNHPYKDHLFDPKQDIPHHIYYGSKGAGAKTELTGTFDVDGKNTKLQVTFKNDGEYTYKISGQNSNPDQALEILKQFNFLFIESHNIDLPQLISIVLEKDGLLSLDNKRKKQSEPLKKLEEFIELSQKAISDIEKDINACFHNLTDFDGVLKDKHIKINFAEFDKLRDVVRTMTSITLHDGNSHGIASKGSGAQRAVFLSLMQFISQNSTKKVIWGIDEPEAFLQPQLQKRVSSVIQNIALNKNQPIILTTHSQHFIDLNNLKHTHIFKGSISTREYKRKPGEVFYEVDTIAIPTQSDHEKANLIKNHLGIQNNDGWEILPYNILVEGEEDKKYFEKLMNTLRLPSQNIIFSGGASKIAGYLQFYDIYARDLSYKPEIVCIFDNDEEGVSQSRKIKPKNYANLQVSIRSLPRHDGQFPEDLPSGRWEIEDFLPPKIVLETINKILRSEGYKIIKKQQVNDRNKTAHLGKQVIIYAEECCTQNNPDLGPLILNCPGRKMQICKKICENWEKAEIENLLNTKQNSFIKSLSK